MQTHKYFTKFRQHNGRVVKRNRTRIELRPSRYLKASQLVQGCHASNSHAGGMYFIYFLTLTTLNFSQPQAGIFQPQTIISITNGYFSTTIQTITTNIYCPWFVDKGRYLYIYIYNVYIAISRPHRSMWFIQRIYNLYIANITYTTLIHVVYNAYTVHISLAQLVHRRFNQI